MSQELKAGVRVRVLQEDHVQGYGPGDTGTVTGGPWDFHAVGPCYPVAMDKDGAGEVAVFAPDEIEPDVRPGTA
jgi:hypothetical protein